MSFADILNKPLQSKTRTDLDEMFSNIEESVFGDTENELVSAIPSGYATEDDDDDDEDEVTDQLNALDDDEDDDDDIDFDDLSDDELAALGKELGGDVLGDLDSDDSGEKVDLTPDEEMHADDMMSVAATSMLVNDELNAEERAEFAKEEGAIAVNEGFMTESDVNQIAYEAGLVQEAKYNNKMIIKLDAASKKKQLYQLAVLICGQAHQDPDYIRYKKVMKMKKILRHKMEQKYHAEAVKRMKIYYARLRNSKSPKLNAIGNKVVK